MTTDELIFLLLDIKNIDVNIQFNGQIYKIDHIENVFSNGSKYHAIEITPNYDPIKNIPDYLESCDLYPIRNDNEIS